MKHLLPLLFACTVIAGCKEVITTPSYNQDIDPAFEAYWQSFKDEADARELNPAVYEQDVSIQFGVLDEDIHGICNDGIGGDSIIISRTYWDTIDDIRREMLIFHEIGHCQLARGHEQEGRYLLSRNVAHTLMIPDLNGSNCVFDIYSSKWRAHYIDELFGFNDEPAWIEMGIPIDSFSASRTALFELTNIQAGGASSPEIDVENEQQFQAVFQNGTSENFSITANDLRINYSYETSGFTIHRGDRQLANVLVFFYSNQVRSGGTVTITLRYVDDYVYFYIGDYLVHFREYPKPASMNLRIAPLGGALDARFAVEGF